MRTLSARILLGFAVLTIAFGGITGNIVYNQRVLERYVGLVNTGLLPISQTMRDFGTRCEDLYQYADDGAERETAASAARMKLVNLRERRDKAFTQLEKFFATYSEVDAIDPRHIYRNGVEALRVRIDSLKVLYDNVQHALEQNDDVTSAGVRDALAPVRDGERDVSRQAAGLTKLVNDNVSDGLRKLQDRETQSRRITITLGTVAVLLGLLMTTWVLITLRPLRRLQNAARRVAAGDYGNRIEENGPAEVADLARELNTMARAVEERERELVRSERLAAVGKMAAMITHEVRNPLSSIGLNTELLEDEVEGNPEARDLVRAIHREVDRLTAITEEYLSFARMPKPKIQAEAINPMVGALAAFVRGDLAAKQVKLQVELAPGDPIALVDAAQLRQCLINLVRNASEALAQKGSGTVSLRTRVVGDRVMVEVEDDGVGIPADVLPRLFDPFFSTKEGGSGLGLALTQQIVKEHGGDLAVQSTAGKGTTFTVSVPAKLA
jgi:two-component system, NtrC family, sensor kinase